MSPILLHKPDPANQVARRPGLRILLVSLLALGAIVAFFMIGAGGNWEFALSFRSRKVAAMVLVAVATAVATVAFQTVTNNRILTPSILGLDALFVFIQTAMIFSLGVTATQTLGARTTFILNLALMSGAALALFTWLFGGRRSSLHLVVLVGIVLGTLLRALSSLINRVLDPTSFLVLQSNLFASFNAVQPDLLGLAAVIVLACTLWMWSRRHALDVLALGPSAAISLGVNHKREVMGALASATLLVSTSTALVGPITFLGLIVANLAYSLAGSHRHQVVLPFAALLAVIMLVGGQAIFEHVLGMAGVLSVIIEFFGGMIFIAIVLRRAT